MALNTDFLILIIIAVSTHHENKIDICIIKVQARESR